MAFNSNMLFDVLANILKTKSFELFKSHIESDHFKDAAPFMIRRYLTMHPNECVRNVVLNHYLTLEKMPAEVQYRWLIMNVPTQNSTFIKYLR